MTWVLLSISLLHGRSKAARSCSSWSRLVAPMITEVTKGRVATNFKASSVGDQPISPARSKQASIAAAALWTV